MSDPLPRKSQSIQIGNANDAIDTRGWFVGNFLNKIKDGVRYSNEVEIKWGNHRAGEERDAWVTGEERTTAAILISGKWEMHFRQQSVILSEQGDYVIWGRGVDHKWRALEDSVIVTIRWPSPVA